MSSPVCFPCSSLGMKFCMGITGFLLVGFVLSHMSGNLLIYMGPDALNEYADLLHKAGHGKLVWVARAVLLTIFATHLCLAFALRKKNSDARPVPYAVDETLQATWASRHMMMTGILILTFVVYHIAHFTLGITDPSGFKDNIPRDAHLRHDVYKMVVHGFQQPLLGGLYIFMQLALGLHLSHGAGSWLQSLGLARGWVRKFVMPLGLGIAILVVAGNCSIPVSILLGWVK